MGEAQADALCAEQGGNHRERDTKPSLNLSKDRMFPNDRPFPVFIYGSITGVLALQKFTKYNHEARCRGEVLEGTVCSRTMWGRGEDSSSSRKAPCMHRPDHCGWGCLATQPIHPQRNRRRNCRLKGTATLCGKTLSPRGRTYWRCFQPQRRVTCELCP